MEKRLKTLGSLTAGPMQVCLDTVLLDDAQQKMRIRIDYPEAAAILAFPEPDHLLLVRQFRYAVGHETLEIPAGKVDPGEEAAACAVRELREETGYQARRVDHLFSYYPAVGYSSERLSIFAAFELERLSGIEDDMEISAVETWRIADVLDMIRAGGVIDGKTALGLMAYQAGFTARRSD